MILVSIFIMFSAAALLLAGFQKSEREAQRRKKQWQRWKVCDSSTYGSSCDTVSESDTEANSDTNADTKRKSKF